MSGRLVLLLVALAAANSYAHLCLIEPPQRGSLNVSDAGDPSCFRHGEPCGGQSAAVGPHPELLYWIQLQQNFNHYQVGFPGYIDVAVYNADHGEPSSDSDFTPVMAFSDRNFHQQSHQMNFSLYTKVRDIISECKHCVLRARYVPHKSGEDPFYQCADFSLIHRPEKAPTKFQTLNSQQQPAMYRHASSARTKLTTNNKVLHAIRVPWLYRAPVSDLVTIEAGSGKEAVIASLPGRIDACQGCAENDNSKTAMLANNVYAYDRSSKMQYFLTRLNGTVDDVPRTLLLISRDGVIQPDMPTMNIPGQINGLISLGDGKSLFIFSIEPHINTSTGSYDFSTYVFDVQTGQLSHGPKVMDEPLYVNFQWLAYDTTSKTVYAVMGDENAPYSLDNKLYAFHLGDGTMTSVIPAYDQFTFSAVYVLGGVLYALSPGLFEPGSAKAWHLVTVDPLTGNVTKKCTVTEAGIFATTYGGAIYAQDSTLTKTLFWRFDYDGDAVQSSIAEINVTSCETTFSEPMIVDPAFSNLAFLD